MSTNKSKQFSPVKAVKARQWLLQWNELDFNPKVLQSRPPEHFYLCSMKASHLKALTGVYRRTVKGGLPRVKDPNVQRGHEEERSETIREFVKYGFPWCEMGEAKRNMPGSSDLRKPGWLPTAILVNILPPNSRRNDVEIPDSDLVRVEESGENALLHFPRNFTGANWEPQRVYPLEVIDGQHRLWAFEGFDPGDDFELPVVAFYGLDRGWQAYLFWSINITPKKINRSLAFDLYPLLRQQSWLDKFAGHSIYRETRCQELVEALWSHPESPWFQRINMLGETKKYREYKGPTVSQAAWVRSLMASFVKQWEGKGTRKIGGIFGAPPSTDELLLPWTRSMQAAVLIFAGRALKKRVEQSKAKWAQHLREVNGQGLLDGDDPAFYGQYSLLSTDQGIRGFLFVVNDLCFIQSESIHLAEWRSENVRAEKTDRKASAIDQELVTAAIKSFAKTDGAHLIDEIAHGLASHDWRTSSTPDLKESERLRQSVFRGSSGYREIRQRLLEHLAEQRGRVGKAAEGAINALGLK